MWNWLGGVFAKLAALQRKRPNSIRLQPARAGLDLTSRFEGLLVLRGQTVPPEAELTAEEQARVEELADRVLAHFLENQPALVEAVVAARGAAGLSTRVKGARSDLGRSLALRSVAALVVFSNCFELKGTLIDRVVERVHVEIGAELQLDVFASEPVHVAARRHSPGARQPGRITASAVS